VFKIIVNNVKQVEYVLAKTNSEED